MKSEPSSATQKETGSWTSGSWAKMAQESGATGVMEGGAGGVGAVAAAVVPAGAVVGAAGATGGVGDCAMSTAATSGKAGSGGMLERESVGADREIGLTDYPRGSCSG